jgi:hypothetical protein
MRASQDPAAVELARQYKVLMPKVELTRKELGDIIEYLEAQDNPRPTPGAAAGGEEK